MDINYIIADIMVDPFISKLVIISTVIILLGYALKVVGQPYIVAYIIAGVFIGPSGFELLTDEKLIANLGSLGLILLLFFVGMEISLPKLISSWRVSIIGTVLQVLISIFFVGILGTFFEWGLNRIILIGFVISLSSTAVVIKILQDRNEVNTRVGENVIGILLVQDLLIIIMLIVINLLGGSSVNSGDIAKQIIGGTIIIATVAWIVRKKEIKLPFSKSYSQDHEMQVFAAFTLCFGLSIFVSFFNLSAALGAFVAGIIVSSSKSTKWVQDSLHSFRVIFIALFFVSVGMLIDLNFLRESIVIIVLLVIGVFLTNNIINSLILKFLGESWKDSFYSGALLSQIGEFSFILAAAGYYSDMINIQAYKLSINLIALTLILSPIWILLSRKISHNPHLPGRLKISTKINKG